MGIARTLPAQLFQGEASVKSALLIVAFPVALAIAAAGSANAGDRPTAGDPSANHVFDLTESAGKGAAQTDRIALADPGHSIEGTAR